MAPARIEEDVPWTSPAYQPEPYEGPPRNVAYIDAIKFNESVKPPKYEILGTDPNSKVLFLDVNILECTGKPPYRGDVFIQGERIKAVGNVANKDQLLQDPDTRVFQGKGRTLMPGLGDSHTHFSWNGGDLASLGGLNVEEHTLLTARSAKCYLDSGYTMCYGAASAKERLDVAIRDAIYAGDIPGPRSLANGKEMAKRDGDLEAAITAFADTPEEMREVIRHHVGIGVDNIKLVMSGEEICEVRSAQDCYFTDEETAVCVDEAHKAGKSICAHARARDSVKMCVKHGVDVIYHGSYIDEEGMDMLEAARTKHVVAPAINWLVATLNDAAAFGYSHEKAEQVGYKKAINHQELEIALRGLREMHRRGIVVLPGGDYGFAWTPHGTYARDLAHFKNLMGFTAHESIIAATYGVAKVMLRADEMGQIKEGNYADCILVDGNPIDNIDILQDHSKLNVIMINGRVHKAGRKELYHRTGPFSFRSAALFVGVGAGMIFYFQFEKKRLERKRVVEMSKGYGKPKVGGPFALKDVDGNDFTDQDLLGKYSLIYFGFSHCPDICPDELDKMGEALDIIQERAPNTVRPVFISCDPNRDTPDVLKAYLAEFHPAILGLVGTWQQTKDVCKQYRVYFSTPPELTPGEEDYLVDHSIYFYVMDPEGDFVECIGRQDTPESAAAIVLQHIKDWKRERKPIDTTPLPYLHKKEVEPSGK
ncbi:hypothetical protein CLAIMM_08212 [Cladophialophora immunda]|nr:hypothetical protein CLAIMM_08212 [Cladophialophora immunda]